MSDESNPEITSQQRMETEHARHQRLMEHTGFLLEKVLARAVEHLGTGTQEVKKITRCNGMTKVELGPVATLDQVLALFQAVRKIAEKQTPILTALEPPRIIVHPVSSDHKPIHEMTNEELDAELMRLIHES